MIRFRKRPIRISFGSRSWSLPRHAFAVAPNRGLVSAPAIRQVLRAVLSLSALLGPEAQAQTDKGGVAAEPVSQEAAPPGVISPSKDPDEVLIIGQRYGEAKVGAETEFSEEEVASHGADSIQDLLTRLQPFIGDGEEEPVLLINGKPAGFDRSVLAYPAEALDRLAVLKPEAAVQYGHASGRRVVNLVLKKHFASLNADAAGSWATGGGQHGGSLSASRVAIDGPTRWNVQARLAYDSALRKSARNIPPRAGVYDGTGHVSAPGGGEIDPALSLAAGTTVTTAAIPAGAVSQVPTLAGFAATAGETDAVDPNDFETLLPSRRNLSLNLGVTRPVGAFSASLNVNASSSASRGTRGLPMVSLVVPAGSLWSPFGGDVTLTRPFADDRALRSDNDTDALGVSLTLGGTIGDWQTSFSAGYSRSWAHNLLESGIDAAWAQQRISGGDADFNPYGRWSDRLLLARRNRSNGENISARANVRKNIVNLPAGPLVVNLSVNASQGRTETWQSDNLGGPAAQTRTARGLADGAVALSVPISRRGEGAVLFLGDLSIDLNAGAQAMTGNRLQKRYGGDVNWSPVRILQLRGSIDHAEAAPTLEQLDGPLVTTINRIFDYARGEIAEPVWITGGNPALGRGSRQRLALNAVMRPLGDQTLSLNIGYRQSVARGGVAGFPELTPVIEAAFPERVTRDGAGRLLAVDARPINIARDTDSELASGIALRLPAKRAMPAANATQLTFSLRHQWRLKSELLTRPGVPVIDQLTQSGQSRHSLSLQATAGKRGLGATVTGNWSSASRVSNADRIFDIEPPVTFNLSMFAEPNRQSGRAGASGLMSGLRISLDIQNVFNGYRRVTLQDGSVPAGYSRDEIDPLGRVIRLTLRKKL